MQTFDNFIIIEEISKELKIPTVEAAEIFEAYFSILNSLILKTGESFKVKYSLGILYSRTINGVKKLLYKKSNWIKFHKITRL